MSHTAARRRVALALAALAAAGLSACAATMADAPPPAGLDRAGTVTTLCFGSCARQDEPQPIWNAIHAERPDLFLFIGDNIYADLNRDVPESAADINAKYALLGDRPEFERFRRDVPILAVWDDHDFGLNDAGAEWPLKNEAQDELLAFFEEPASSPRWDREGVYGAWTIGPAGRRVQIILLDTRYHRSALTKNPDGRPRGLGPYVKNANGEGTILGEAQWAWLEAQLRAPADVRIIASSIQIVAEEHRWECWGNMPHERWRLYDLIGETGAEGVVFLSGDRHLIEISMDPFGPYPMWDFTSSGMNWGDGETNDPNRYRVGPVHRTDNFGVVSIDWDRDDPLITMIGKRPDGSELTRAEIPLSTLTPSG